MARIDSFLRAVVDRQASDLHFHAGNRPMLRHHGDLLPLPYRVLSAAETQRMLEEILPTELQSQFAREHDIDFSYVLPGIGRFRCNYFVQQQGPGAVFRVIPEHLPTLDQLGLPSSIKRLARLNNGLVLITGPTGSGKTTTLAALLHEINGSSQRHIITIEDPIEFVFQPLRCAVTQRQVGEHTQSFAEALRAALRESPDVLVVGELRDSETIALALSAAETGVLVLGTLHTNTAAEAVNRVIDALPGEVREQARGVLSVVLRGVVAQRLCKSMAGDARVAMTEILLPNWAVASMIREGKTHQIESFLHSVNYQQTGMQSLDQCIIQAVRDFTISLDEGLTVAKDPVDVRHACAQAPGEE